MLDALFAVLLVVLDLYHCARWQETPHGPRCAAIRLDARCLHAGWHEVFGGVPVCVRDCPGGRPTT